MGNPLGPQYIPHIYMDPLGNIERSPQVPTDKARAFAFDIDWEAVHAPFLQRGEYYRAY